MNKKELIKKHWDILGGGILMLVVGIGGAVGIPFISMGNKTILGIIYAVFLVIVITMLSLGTRGKYKNK